MIPSDTAAPTYVSGSQHTEHVEEKILTQSNDFDPNRKTVFLIGDSITLGYREYVRNELSDFANVVYPQENGRCTQYIIISLRKWSGLCDPAAVDLVQFNAGHWDIAHWNNEEISLTSIEQYCLNIQRINDSLHRIFKNAVIVFATTTRMNPNGSNSKNFRTTEEIIQYNKAVKEAISGKDVIINDLYALTENFKEEDFADYCHMADHSKRFVAHRCAELYKEFLK